MDSYERAVRLSDALLAFISEHTGISKAMIHSVLSLEQQFWIKHFPELQSIEDEDE